MLFSTLVSLLCATLAAARYVPVVFDDAPVVPLNATNEACVASSKYPPGYHTVTMTFESRTRKFELFVPAGTAATGLILSFHGYTNNGKQQETMTKFPTIGSDFIQISPYGTDENDSKGNLGWNAGGCCGGATKVPSGSSKGIDDVGFAKALVKFANDNFPGCFPTKAVFATGFSNGGFFSHRLACEADDVFLGVAPHSGYLSFGGDFKSCSPKNGVSILHIHGTSDVVVPFNRIIGYSLAVGFNHNRNLWLANENCNSGSPRTDTTSGNKWECTRTYGGNCKDGAIVEYCKITGLGHSWSTSFNFNSSQRIIEFFRSLAKGV